MRKWFKRGVVGLAVLAMVAVVGLAIFLLTFDPNAYKYELGEAVQVRYNRTLSIDGDIELSLFPRLGLNVQGVSLSEAGRPDDEFVSIDSTRVAVAIWPLLFNKLVVDHVAIDGFRAQVVRQADGRFNFQDLIPGNPSTSSFSGKSATPEQIVAGGVLGGLQTGVQVVTEAVTVSNRVEMGIDIAGLNLHDGEIFLRDVQSTAAVRVVDLNVNTGRITFDQPFDINVSARVKGETPAIDTLLTGHGLIKLDPAAMQYAVQRLDVRVEGEFLDFNAKQLTARGNVSFDGLLRSLDVSGLDLVFQGDLANSNLRNVEASLTVPRLLIDSARQQLKLDKLAVRARGSMPERAFEASLNAPSLQISATQAKGDAVDGRWHSDGKDTLDANFHLAGLSGGLDALDINNVKLDGVFKQGERLVKMQLASPLVLSITQRTVALTTMQGDVDINDPELPKGRLQIPLIGSLAADLRKDQASAKIDAVLEGGAFDLSVNAAKLTTQPSVTFALVADTLDFDKLIPPAPIPELTPAPPTGQGDGTPKSDEMPSRNAQRSAQTQRLSDQPIDVSIFHAVTANGSIKIGDLRVRGLKAHDLCAELQIKNGRLEVSTQGTSMYQGNLVGMVFIDAAKPISAGASLALTGMSLEPLLSDLAGESRLRGTGSLTIDLAVTGNTPTVWRNTLDGSVQARLRDGAIQGIDATQILLTLKTALGGGHAASGAAQFTPETDFGTLDADLIFAKGVGTVRNLSLVSPLLRMNQGKPATVDVVNNTLDLVVAVRVVNPSAQQGGKELEAFKGIAIPVHLVGPFEKPRYSILWNQAGGEAARRTLENQLKRLIRGGADSKSSSDKTVRDIGKAFKEILKR